VITRSKGCPENSLIGLLRQLVVSMPRSLSTRCGGWTYPAGFDPAEASTDRYSRAKWSPPFESGTNCPCKESRPASSVPHPRSKCHRMIRPTIPVDIQFEIALAAVEFSASFSAIPRLYLWRG
jgi:hypothetical protein